MKTKQEKIINNFRQMSLRYHKLSLLFNELAGSLNIQYKKLGKGRVKAFKDYLKSLNINIDLLEKKVKEDMIILGVKNE